MSYKIIDIEGIGATYAAKLNKQQIFTTEDLLAKCGAKSGRAAVATATEIPESLVLTWANHADLMRINGIGSQFSELLEAAGVDSVKELAMRNADNLHVKIKETNEKFGLSGRIPSFLELQEMINQAKSLEQMVFH